MKNVWTLKDCLKIVLPAMAVWGGAVLLGKGGYDIGHTDGAVYGADLIRKASRNVYDDYDEKMTEYIEQNGLDDEEE